MTVPPRVSLEEFLARPEIDERRLELIDGEVHEKMSPRWGHGRIAGRVCEFLNRVGFASVEPRAIIPPGAAFGASAPLPDVAFYRENPPAADEWMTRPPDVAVEILSIGQSRLEMRLKVDRYIQFGIRSVWVIDPERESVDLYEDGVRRTISGDDLLESPHAPGFSATVSELLAP